MSIGLYDLDMAKYGQVPFNLELMKTATYYKGRNEIVILSPTFAPHRYSKFIIRKDYSDGDFPKHLHTYKNIEYGGYAFTKGKYFPLSLGIEKSVPDLSIYNRWASYFGGTQEARAILRRMNRSHHLRLSLDGKTIWEDYRKQLSSISYPQKYIYIFHDYNLNGINGAYEEIKELLKINEKEFFIGTKFPIQVSSTEEILKWLDFRVARNLYWFQINGLIDDEAFVEMVEKLKDRPFDLKIDYLITKNCLSEEECIKKVLPKVFRQISYSRSKRRKILLKYDDLFFSDTRWEEVIELINYYNTSLIDSKVERFDLRVKYDSMYSFATNLVDKAKFQKHVVTKPEARELFQFVRVNSYELFKSFYECNVPELKGGIFYDRRIRGAGRNTPQN